MPKAVLKVFVGHGAGQMDGQKDDHRGDYMGSITNNHSVNESSCDRTKSSTINILNLLHTKALPDFYTIYKHSRKQGKVLGPLYFNSPLMHCILVSGEHFTIAWSSMNSLV